MTYGGPPGGTVCCKKCLCEQQRMVTSAAWDQREDPEHAGPAWQILFLIDFPEGCSGRSWVYTAGLSLHCMPQPNHRRVPKGYSNGNTPFLSTRAEGGHNLAPNAPPAALILPDLFAWTSNKNLTASHAQGSAESHNLPWLCARTAALCVFNRPTELWQIIWVSQGERSCRGISLLTETHLAARETSC